MCHMTRSHEHTCCQSQKFRFSLRCSQAFQIMKNMMCRWCKVPLSVHTPAPTSPPRLQEAREFFKHPEVTLSADLPKLKWVSPNEEELVNFLVHEKQFSEDRVRKVSCSGQKRVDDYFGGASGSTEWCMSQEGSGFLVGTATTVEAVS